MNEHYAAYRTPSEAAKAFKAYMGLLLEQIKKLPPLEQSRAEKIPHEASKSFEQVISVEDDQRPRWIEKTRDLLTELERLFAGQRMLFASSSPAARVVARYVEAEDAVGLLFKFSLDILDHIEEIIQADTMRQMGIKPKPGAPGKRGPKAPKTYAKAQLEVMVLLGRRGWGLSKALKIPYATSPDGTVRFWFKAQAIYMSHGDRVNDMGSARSTWSDDYRFMDAAEFVKILERIATKAGAKLS